ncbi:oxidoreductase NAD-binding domain-containing protein [Xylaria sp. CBS 124048]|nr:oxidoreductase NAD-binding domain-containing protein [Xylaria sp. CBS 124048]
MTTKPILSLSGRLPTVIATVAVAGVGLGIYSRHVMAVAHADNGASAPPLKAFGGGPAFLSLQLQSSEVVNHNTKKLRFALPTPEHVSGLGLTSALLTFSWPQGCMLPCLRPYTPISSSDEPGILELMVKKYPNGKQSTHIHSLRPGDSLRFVVPIPGYKWTPNKHPTITLIAGGAGITPMYQLIQGILKNPEDKTRINLIFGVNTDEDVLFKSEFEDLHRRFPNRFAVTYTVSHPVPDSPYPKGYVTKELLDSVMITTPETENTKIFVCGPPAMENALVGTRSKPGILTELGYRKDQIYKF